MLRRNTLIGLGIWLSAACRSQAVHPQVDAARVEVTDAWVTETAAHEAAVPSVSLPAALRLEGAQPTGCVGWLPSTGQLACVEGLWGRGVSGTQWALRVHGEPAVAAMDLAPSRQFAASTAVTDDPLPHDKRDRVNRWLNSQGFIAFSARWVDVSSAEWTRVGDVAEVRLVRARVRDARYSERVELRWVGRDALTVVSDERSVASGDNGPELSATVLGERAWVAIARDTQRSDRGIAATESRAWRCSVLSGQCD
ncbi:MAG: hypothetical protein Q8Q09_13900 [Deltaproteobacteria bacterium]|nr:hypothetical protein [Deltaproteobacteria bacterium]